MGNVKYVSDYNKSKYIKLARGKISARKTVTQLDSTYNRQLYTYKNTEMFK